jgi:nucleotide-binding universal stress UspA family protein
MSRGRAGLDDGYVQPESRVLCAIDRDEHATGLVVAARRLAAVTGWRPLFVHALAPRARGARRRRGHALSWLLRSGIGADELWCEIGDARATVMRLVHRVRPALALVGPTRRNVLAEAVVGSVRAALVRDGSCPVAVVCEHTDASFSGGPLVCGMSLEEDEPAPGWAGRLAAQAGRWLVLGHVVGGWTFGALGPVQGVVGGRELLEAESASAGERLRAARDAVPESVCADVSLRYGTAGLALAELATELEADAVIVGVHRHGRLHDALLGSVSRTVWTNARCPVIVVPASSVGSAFT